MCADRPQRIGRKEITAKRQIRRMLNYFRSDPKQHYCAYRRVQSLIPFAPDDIYSTRTAAARLRADFPVGRDLILEGNFLFMIIGKLLRKRKVGLVADVTHEAARDTHCALLQ